ncbi:flippase [Furfurilactobacillus curtus]|uniref:Flippase n=1 Tax=Furfurilactobacillus curtus TaxID=1746200 RepID=A0ABQ5JP73_9LACO
MRVLKNYLYNVTYQLLVLIIPLVTIPYLARHLGPTGVGINAYTSSIMSYFALLGSLGISLYGTREIAMVRDNATKRSQLFWEIEGIQFVISMAALLAFYVFVWFQPQYQSYFLLQSITLIGSAVDISWFFMGLEDFRKTVVRDAFVRIISLIVIFTWVKQPQDLWIYILVLALSGLLGNLSLWPYLHDLLTHVPHQRLQIWRHLRPSLILFVPTASMQLYILMNKTFLKHMVSVQASGFMDYSDRIINIALIVVTSLSAVVLPHISNLFAQHDLNAVHRSLYRSFQYVSAIAIPIAFGLYAVASPIVNWLLTPRFGLTGILLMIQAPCIVLIAWNNAIGKQYLIPVNRVRDYTLAVSFGALLNVFLNLGFIHWFGVYGAAYATVGTEVFVTGVELLLVRHQLKFTLLFHNLWKFLVAAAVMNVIVIICQHHLPATLPYFVLEISIGALVYGLGLLALRTDSVTQVLSHLRSH